MSERKLKTLELFEGVGVEETEEFRRAGDYVNLKNNQVLFTEGEPLTSVYIILFGSFKMIRQGGHGAPVIFNFLGRNEALGISVVRLPQPQYPVTAVANEQSSVFRIKLADFNRLISKSPILEQRIYLQILRRFREFQEDRCFEKARVSRKLAQFLLRTLEDQQPSCRSQIAIPLTRKDIARRIGAENETVVRLLSSWTKNGWIQTHSKHIEVINLKELAAIKNAQPDSDDL